MPTASFCRSVQCFIFATFIGAISTISGAQSQPASRITQPIDNRVGVTLKGNVHPLVQARYDQGPVADSFPAERMLLLLQRSPDREAALQQFLQEAHRQGSPSFHRWLTPEQFGVLYGPSDSEIAAVQGWLQQQGFLVAHVTRGKTAMEFSGTAGQVRSASHRDSRLCCQRRTALRQQSRSASPGRASSVHRWRHTDE